MRPCRFCAVPKTPPFHTASDAHTVTNAVRHAHSSAYSETRSWSRAFASKGLVEVTLYRRVPSVMW